jgi:hypothetical protein
MRTKRTAKTADQKDLDTLWSVMDWAVRMREMSLCVHVLRQIDELGRAVSAETPFDQPAPAKPRGRPRKAKVEADQLDLKVDGSAQPPATARELG